MSTIKTRIFKAKNRTERLSILREFSDREGYNNWAIPYFTRPEEVLGVELCWDHRISALFASDCAEHVLHLFDAHSQDTRPREAIQAARSWASNPTEGNRAIASYAAGQAKAAADLASLPKAQRHAAESAALAAEVAAREVLLPPFLDHDGRKTSSAAYSAALAAGEAEGRVYPLYGPKAWERVGKDKRRYRREQCRIERLICLEKDWQQKRLKEYLFGERE